MLPPPPPPVAWGGWAVYRPAQDCNRRTALATEHGTTGGPMAHPGSCARRIGSPHCSGPVAQGQSEGTSLPQRRVVQRNAQGKVAAVRRPLPAAAVVSLAPRPVLNSCSQETSPCCCGEQLMVAQPCKKHNSEIEGETLPSLIRLGMLFSLDFKMCRFRCHCCRRHSHHADHKRSGTGRPPGR